MSGGRGESERHWEREGEEERERGRQEGRGGKGAENNWKGRGKKGEKT